MKTFLTALRALLYGSAFVLLWGWLALNIRSFDENFAVEPPQWTSIIGIMLMSFGGVLALACVGLFVMRGKGTGAPFEPPREFVVAGPYRYVRNPMYIGGWLALIGFGLYEHSLSILLFSLPWLLLVHLFVVFYEEPNLERRFGQSYLNYKNSVRRWRPRMS